MLNLKSLNNPTWRRSPVALYTRTPSTPPAHIKPTFGMRTPAIATEYVRGFEALPYGGHTNGSATVSWVNYPVLDKLSRSPSSTYDEHGVRTTPEGDRIPITQETGVTGKVMNRLLLNNDPSRLFGVNMSVVSRVYMARDLISGPGEQKVRASTHDGIRQNHRFGTVIVEEGRPAVFTVGYGLYARLYSPVPFANLVSTHLYLHAPDGFFVVNRGVRADKNGYTIGFSNRSTQENASLALEVTAPRVDKDHTNPIRDFTATTFGYTLNVLTENLRLFLNTPEDQDPVNLAMAVTRLIYAGRDNPNAQIQKDDELQIITRDHSHYAVDIDSEILPALPRQPNVPTDLRIASRAIGSPPKEKHRIFVQIRDDMLQLYITRLDTDPHFIELPPGLVPLWEFIKWNTLSQGKTQAAFRKVLSTKRPMVMTVTYKGRPWELSFVFDEMTDKVVMTAQCLELREQLKLLTTTQQPATTADLQKIIEEAYLSQDYETLLQANLFMADQYFVKGFYDDALHFYQEAWEMLRAKGSLKQKTETLHKMTHILAQQDKKAEAYSYCLFFLQRRHAIKNENTKVELILQFVPYLWNLANDRDQAYQDATKLIWEVINDWPTLSTNSKMVLATPLMRIFDEMTSQFAECAEEIKALRQCMTASMPIFSSPQGGADIEA